MFKVNDRIQVKSGKYLPLNYYRDAGDAVFHARTGTVREVFEDRCCMVLLDGYETPVVYIMTELEHENV